MLTTAITKNNHSGVTVLTLSHDYITTTSEFTDVQGNCGSQRTVANDNGRNSGDNRKSSGAA